VTPFIDHKYSGVVVILDLFIYLHSIYPFVYLSTRRAAVKRFGQPVKKSGKSNGPFRWKDWRVENCRLSQISRGELLRKVEWRRGR